MPLSFIIRASKILMRLNAFFEGFQWQNVLTMYVLIFHETFVPVNGKKTPNVNKSNFYMV